MTQSLTVTSAAEAELARTILALEDIRARFSALVDCMPQMVWSALPDGVHDYYNAHWYEFTGARPGSPVAVGWKGVFHEEDADWARACWRRALETGEPHEAEYRLLRHDGAYRWVLSRARPIRDDSNRIVRWIGTCTDIDDRKRLEHVRKLVSSELNHRIKNTFAVISALTALSARHLPPVKEFATTLRARISALARAHEFVQPHSEVFEPVEGSMTLHAFLESLFGNYMSKDGQLRIILSGDDAVFDDQSATSVALLFHELATNAAKYGALSVDSGRVLLETQHLNDRYVLTWRERGGPNLAGKPAHTGFGSSLAALSVEGQLEGRMQHFWDAEGLTAVIDIPAVALARRRAEGKAVCAPLA